MAVEQFANLATTTVFSGGTSAPAALTTESWTMTSSAGFPAASNSTTPPTQFRIVDPALPSEVILVTNVSGLTWSVTRGWEGTTPVAHSGGFTVNQVITAGALSDMTNKFLTVYKTSDEGLTNNSTLQNDNQLVLPVEANSKYLLDGYLDYDGAYDGGGPQGGLKAAFTFPASATIRWAGNGLASAGLGILTATSNSVSQNGTMTFGTYGTGGGHNAVMLSGYITTAGTAGNLQLQWSQITANGTATTVYTGSFIRLQKLAE